MAFSHIVSQMLVLTLLIVLGFYAGKRGIMDENLNTRIAHLLINIAVPCMILASVKEEVPFADASSLLFVLAVFAVVNAMAPFIAWFFVRLLRIQKEKNLYQFMFSLTNAGFMGLPVIQSVFGNKAMTYAAIFLLPNNVLSYVYGIGLFQKQRQIDWKKIWNAPVICSVIAVLISLFHIKEPQILYQAMDMTGSMTTPLAMLIIGSSLASANFGEMKKDRLLIPFVIVKMILIPLFNYAVLRLFVRDAMLLTVCVMMTAMPVATNAVVFSSAYGGNLSLSSRCVFITSIVSVITIPVFALLFI